jgi:parallel beta-helix repeat protein
MGGTKKLALICVAWRLMTFSAILKVISVSLSCLLMLHIGVLPVQSCENSDNLELDNDWIDCGGAIWYLDVGKDLNSTSSLRSGPIEDSGVSKICRVVKGPATLCFEWKNDGYYPEIGQLCFLVNGERRYICDSLIWKNESIDLRYEGDYILSWEFVKFKSYPKGRIAGWLRNLSIKPHSVDSMKYQDINYSENYIQADSQNYTQKENETIKSQKNNPIEEIYLSVPSPGQRGPNNVSVNASIEFSNNDTFKTIQEAVNAVQEPGVVEVYSGIYKESINITKSLTLRGFDRNNTIIIDPKDDFAIKIYSQNVVVENLTLNGKNGINVFSANNCNMSNLTIQNCSVVGIFLDHANNCNVTSNLINTKGFAIELFYSNNNYIVGNAIENIVDGICVRDSIDNIFKNYDKKVQNTFYCRNATVNDYPEGLINCPCIKKPLDGGIIKVYNGKSCPSC